MKNADYWILKYKSANWTSENIGRKLNMSAEEVDRIWDQMVAQSKTEESNGMLPLSHQYTVMAYQYQCLGESLKIVATALSNEAAISEIAELIDSDPIASAGRLHSRLIVLRPYQFQDPEKALQDTLKRQATNS